MTFAFRVTRNIIAFMQIDHERLKSRRKQLRISQMELARKVGIDQSTLSKIENGHPLTDSEIQEKFAEALGVSVHWICGKIEIDQPATDDITPIEHALFSAMDATQSADWLSRFEKQIILTCLIHAGNILAEVAKERWLKLAEQLRDEAIKKEIEG